MKKNYYRTFIMGMVIVGLTMNFTTSAQQISKMTTKEASNWYNRFEWLQGIPFNPEKSIDKVEFAKQYNANKIWWDKAFAFMKDKNNELLKPGVYPIDGENVFAKITEVPSKPFDEPKWENHAIYADIQYVVNGQELMGIGSLAKATVAVPYNKEKDITFFEGKGKYYVAKPGNFFIFFTPQIHRPSIKVAGFDVVKKIVIKVRCT